MLICLCECFSSYIVILGKNRVLMKYFYYTPIFQVLRKYALLYPIENFFVFYFDNIGYYNKLIVIIYSYHSAVKFFFTWSFAWQLYYKLQAKCVSLTIKIVSKSWRRHSLNFRCMITESMNRHYWVWFHNDWIEKQLIVF